MISALQKAIAMKVGSSKDGKKRPTIPKPQVASRRSETNRRHYGDR